MLISFEHLEFYMSKLNNARNTGVENVQDVENVF